ncbi:PIN domain-containing protein [Methylomonas sp. SURF-2]|uniref:PIN domain-containing protein n=1 Tax=Methylomonas subterranea TaxID=2952225 RepID=A0ABT1TL29_9GAMM|nr:PIN domain-containing protein [Methylomonas sp. SURF-2]MCQ8106180.1 PIN domain-containing protein [Methylomonas sp. SURF-2]
MKTAKPFFDTNVLLYLLSADQRKADRTETLLSAGGTISVQVLNEFASVASRKLRMPYPEIRETLQIVKAVCATQALNLEIHENGLLIAERYGFSLYDSMIVSAALLAGCKVLFSEDMQHGQEIEGGLIVINPFAEIA